MKQRWGGTISSILQMQENMNITTINNERYLDWGRWQQWSSYIAKLNRRREREGKEKGEISENKCSAMPSALRCYLIFSFPSSYNHTFSSKFLHLQLKMILPVCTCAFVASGLSSKNNLTWQNMLNACMWLLFSPESDSVTNKKVVVYDAYRIQYASYVRF